MTYICFGFENYAQALIDIDSDLQKHIYKKISPIELSSFMLAMSKYGFTGTELEFFSLGCTQGFGHMRFWKRKL
jgi:hypothetical protein